MFIRKINPKIFLSISIYLGWFGCVYFGKMGWEFASLIFPAISWSLLQITFPLNRRTLLRLLIILCIGVSFDSIGAYFDLIQINPVVDMGWLPVWMISIWLVFISSLPLLQNLLQKKYLLACLLGAIFGPLSYRAGARFGTLLLNGNLALVIYGIFWAIYMPGAIYWLQQEK